MPPHLTRIFRTANRGDCSAVCFQQASATTLNFEVLDVPHVFEVEPARFQEKNKNIKHHLHIMRDETITSSFWRPASEAVSTSVYIKIIKVEHEKWTLYINFKTCMYHKLWHQVFCDFCRVNLRKVLKLTNENIFKCHSHLCCLVRFRWYGDDYPPSPSFAWA